MNRGVRPVAPGVWRVAGGRPLPTMNVYLIEDDGGGVTMFDGGVKSMVKQIAAACDGLGGLNRIVLGHGHPDHRGAAPGLGAPVYCHPDNLDDTTTDAGRHYFDFRKLPIHGRAVYPFLLNHWDGGPVEVAGTIAEGEEISGFTVVDISGHAPGMIALFRQSDGIALTTDCFYTIDPLSGIKGKPRLPHPTFNLDQEGTRAAVRKLAELDPRAAWAGHANPVTEDVRATLVAVANARP